MVTLLPSQVTYLFYSSRLKNEDIEEKDQICTKISFSYFTVTSRIDFLKQASEGKRKKYINSSIKMPCGQYNGHSEIKSVSSRIS